MEGVPVDEGMVRAICTAVGVAGGAIAARFFKWSIDRARLAADNARYTAIETSLAVVHKEVERCHKREMKVRVQNARQQAEIDVLRQDIEELQSRIQEMSGLKAGSVQESTATVQEVKVAPSNSKEEIPPSPNYKEYKDGPLNSGE